jgi:hypothetical protein
VANLDFWSDEVAHCLAVLDQYKSRFDRLAAAQKAYVERHQTVVFDPHNEWSEPTSASARLDRIPDKDRLAARSELCEAWYRLIVRCCRAGLIDEAVARRVCDRHSISVDPRDVRG